MKNICDVKRMYIKEGKYNFKGSKGIRIIQIEIKLNYFIPFVRINNFWSKRKIYFNDFNL